MPSTGERYVAHSKISVPRQYAHGIASTLVKFVDQRADVFIYGVQNPTPVVWCSHSVSKL